MAWTDTEQEFDDFADTYDWISATMIFASASPIRAACSNAINRLQPHRILDCACGPGRQAIALKRLGYAVTGSDISSKMIGLARRHARDAGLRIPFSIAAWHELPDTFTRHFDFVMCHGNAIGHCPGRTAMKHALQGIRNVTREKGHVFIDTRSWEWFRANTRPYWVGGTADDDDGHHIILYSCEVPSRWATPHRISIIHIAEHDGVLRLKHHAVTFYAFKIGQLTDSLHEAGFTVIETDYHPGSAQYYVLAQAA